MIVKWTKGHPDRIVASIANIEDDLMPLAVDIVTESVQKGAELQEEALNAAVTPYGEKRFASGRGGSAGRNDTGNMIAKITTGVEEHGHRVIGFWGWDGSDPHEDEYIQIQERTAQSLWTSFVPTREEFFRKIIRATKKGF